MESIEFLVPSHLCQGLRGEVTCHLWLSSLAVLLASLLSLSPAPELNSKTSHPMVLGGAEPCSLGYCSQSPCPHSTVSPKDTPISVITVLGIHLETGHLGHF